VNALSIGLKDERNCPVDGQRHQVGGGGDLQHCKIFVSISAAKMTARKLGRLEIGHAFGQRDWAQASKLRAHP